MDLLSTLISEHFPQFFFAVVVAVVTIFLTRFYMETHKVLDDYPSSRQMLSEIHAGLILLNTVLLEKNVISQSCYSGMNSPRVLNEAGRELLKESEADKLYNQLQEGLLKELEGQEVTTLLALEQASLQLLLLKRNEPEFKPLQDFAFEHPTFKKNPLSYIDILYAMSLLLRDAYRERHTELEIE